MKFKSWIVAAVQLLVVLGMAANYQIARDRLPRAWALALPYDPEMPIRGRYVRLQLVMAEPTPGMITGTARLRVSVDGKLTATPDPKGSVSLVRMPEDRVALLQPVAFFIPEHIADPSVRPAGEELWVEVTVPESGPPHPIRLGVKKDGVLNPLEIH